MKKVTKTEVEKIADIYQYPECSPMPLLQGICLSGLESTQTRCSWIIWVQTAEERLPWERTVRRGMVVPALLGSSEAAFDPLPSPSVPVEDPCHVPRWSRPDPDPLTWLPSLDLHPCHHYSFLWQPRECWLTLVTITRLAALFFLGYYGTGPLLVQSQPSTCLGVALGSWLTFPWGASCSCCSLTTPLYAVRNPGLTRPPPSKKPEKKSETNTAKDKKPLQVTLGIAFFGRNQSEYLQPS